MELNLELKRRVGGPHKHDDCACVQWSKNANLYNKLKTIAKGKSDD